MIRTSTAGSRAANKNHSFILPLNKKDNFFIKINNNSIGNNFLNINEKYFAINLIIR